MAHMPRTVIMLFVAALLAPLANGATPAEVSTSYRLGKTSIKMVAPPGFLDVSQRGPELLDGARTMISAPNQLIAMYVTPADIDTVAAGNEPVLSRFFLLATPMSQDHESITMAQFEEEATLMREKQASLFQKVLPGVREKNDKFSASMRKYGDDKTFAMNIGNVTPLGVFYSAPGALTTGAIARYSAVVDGKSQPYLVVVASTMLRLEDKIVTQNIYSRYRSNKDIEWVRDSARKWAIAARALN